MMDYKNRELLENTYRRARLIAMALLGSLFVDVAVVEMMRWFNPFAGLMDPETGLSPRFQYLIMIIGLSDLIFLPFLRRSLLTARDSAPPAILIPRLISVSIVTLAVSYAPALLGLGIFLLWGNRLPFYVLWGVSFVVMLGYFPRQSVWEEWVGGGGRMEV